jgi:hypothetical protein
MYIIMSFSVSVSTFVFPNNLWTRLQILVKLITSCHWGHHPFAAAAYVISTIFVQNLGGEKTCEWHNYT